MALDKTTLQSDIETMLQDMEGVENRTDAIEKFAADLSDAIDKYVKTASIYATPADVVNATMVAGGYAVAATNNLNSTIQ